GCGARRSRCPAFPSRGRRLPRRRMVTQSAQPRALLHPFQVRLAPPLPGWVLGPREVLSLCPRLLMAGGTPAGGLRRLLRRARPGASLLRPAARPRRALPLGLERRGRLAAHVLRPAVRIVRPRHGALPELDVARGPAQQHRAFIELGLAVAQTERNDGAGARAQRAAHEDPLQIAAGDDRAEHSARRGADGGALEDAALVRRQPRLRLDHFRRERVAPVADPEAIEVDADRGDVAGPRGRVDARDDAADHRAGRDDGPAIRGHEGRDHRRSEALADLGAPRVQRFVEPHVHDRAAGDEVGAAERRRLHGGTRLDLGAAAGAEREDRGDGERGDPAHAIHLHPWFPSEDTMSQRGGGASRGPAAETDVHCAVRRHVPRAVNSRRWILSRGAAAGAATVSILRSRWEEPMAGEPDVSGKVVLITGASHGLGKALAETFARGGARVALCARGEADVAALAESLVASGAEVVWR